MIILKKGIILFLIILFTLSIVKAVNLVFIPQAEEKPNLITVVITSDDKSFREEKLLRLNLVNYEDVLKTELILPGPVDPRKSNIIKLRIINQHNFDFKSLKIGIKSAFFDKQEIVDLEPFET